MTESAFELFFKTIESVNLISELCSDYLADGYLMLLFIITDSIGLSTKLGRWISLCCKLVGRCIY